MTRVLLFDVVAPRIHHRGKKHDSAAWITSNDRRARLGTASLTAKWIKAATNALPEGVKPFTGRVRILAQVFKPQVHYDPNNWNPTAKAIVDAVVRAGILVDDDWKHVEGPDMRHGGKCARGNEHIIITITEE